MSIGPTPNDRLTTSQTLCLRLVTKLFRASTKGIWSPFSPDSTVACSPRIISWNRFRAASEAFVQDTSKLVAFRN